MRLAILKSGCESVPGHIVLLTRHSPVFVIDTDYRTVPLLQSSRENGNFILEVPPSNAIRKYLPIPAIVVLVPSKKHGVWTRVCNYGVTARTA
jgi:hypothetical protein